MQYQTPNWPLGDEWENWRLGHFMDELPACAPVIWRRWFSKTRSTDGVHSDDRARGLRLRLTTPFVFIRREITLGFGRLFATQLR